MAHEACFVRFEPFWLARLPSCVRFNPTSVCSVSVVETAWQVRQQCQVPYASERIHTEFARASCLAVWLILVDCAFVFNLNLRKRPRILRLDKKTTYTLKRRGILSS